MAGTNTKQKRDNNQSAALRDALTRRRIECTRSICEDLIQNCGEHLNKCHEPGCLKCKDAKVLIPHYQAQMETALRDCEAVK